MDDYGALRDKEKADMKEEIRDLRQEIESARARLHTANLARIAAVKGAPRETHNMTIKRYKCFTGHDATNYDATETKDGPWVTYDDHQEAMQKLWQTADTRERMNAQTIATLRDQITRRDEEVSDLRHEIESARDAARGENALRLEAERERAGGEG